MVHITSKQFWLGLNDLQEKSQSSIFFSIYSSHIKLSFVRHLDLVRERHGGCVHALGGRPNTGHSLACSHASSFMADILALCETVDSVDTQ